MIWLWFAFIVSAVGFLIAAIWSWRVSHQLHRAQMRRKGQDFLDTYPTYRTRQDRLSQRTAELFVCSQVLGFVSVIVAVL